MARTRTLIVVALSGVTLAALPIPAAQARVVFDEVFTGPSVAAMYPSGVEWDSRNDRIVVADTGRNRISFYSLSGNRLGGFGRYGTANGRFDTPRDVAIDGRGRIYVADAANHRVQAFSANGSFRWRSPGMGPCDACLNTPIGLTWDSQNSVLLVASTGQDRIKAFTAGGSVAWQSPPGGQIGIDAPRDAARRGGQIWIADYAHHQVKAFDVQPNGTWDDDNPDVTIGTGTQGQGNEQLWFPYNVDFNGAIAYISSTGNSQVRVWDISGAPTFVRSIGVKCQTTICNPQNPPDNRIEDLRRVVVTDAGQLITADFWGNGLKVFNAGGGVVRDIEGYAAPRRGLAEAFGVDVAPNGAVYAIDRLNQHAEWYTSNGAFRRTAGSRDTLSWPEAVAVGGNGVWITNTREGFIQRWNSALTARTANVNLDVTGYLHDLDVAPNGDVFVAVGQPGPENRVYRIPSGSSTKEPFGPVFDDPQGVAVGGNFVYVANAGANEIVKLRRSTGAVVRRSSLQLHGPQGVAVAPNGRIWVADTRADRVVRLSTGLARLEAFKPRGRRAFDLPHTLAVSPNGNFLYVADTFNNRIQRYRI